LIGTPTVSRLLCEHILQCFGFPKVKPEAVEEIMSNVVSKNLRSFMKVSLPQFALYTTASILLGPIGVGVAIGIVGCILSAAPASRMLFKCACDMVLILERAFRYQGKYISVKQLEDAAVYYTTETTKTFSGKTTLLQQHVHDEVDRLIPLKDYRIGFTSQKLRGGLQDIIYMNRYDMSVDNRSLGMSELEGKAIHLAARAAELDSKSVPAELEGMSMRDPMNIGELEGDSRLPDQVYPGSISSRDTRSTQTLSLRGTLSSPTTTTTAVYNIEPTEPLGLPKKAKSSSSTGSLFKKSIGRFRSKK
jgi:hypothetical protein